MTQNNRITVKHLIKSIEIQLKEDSSSGCRVYEFPLVEIEDPYNSSKIFLIVTRLDSPRDLTKTSFAVRTFDENSLEFGEFKLVKGIDNLIAEAKYWYVFYRVEQDES